MIIFSLHYTYHDPKTLKISHLITKAPDSGALGDAAGCSSDVRSMTGTIFCVGGAAGSLKTGPGSLRAGCR